MKERKLISVKEIESLYLKDLLTIAELFDISIKISAEEDSPSILDSTKTIWNIYFDSKDDPIRLSTEQYVDPEEFSNTIVDLIFAHSALRLNIKDQSRLLDMVNKMIKSKELEETEDSNDKDEKYLFQNLNSLHHLAVQVVKDKYIDEIIDRFNHIAPAIFNMSKHVINNNRGAYITIRDRRMDRWYKYILSRNICLSSIKDFVLESIKDNGESQENLSFCNKFSKMMNDIILDSYVDYNNPYIARGRFYYAKDNYDKLYWNSFILDIIDKYNKAVVNNKDYVRTQIQRASEYFSMIDNFIIDDDLYEFEIGVSEGYIDRHGLVIIIMNTKVIVGIVSTNPDNQNTPIVNPSNIIHKIDVPYHLYKFISEYNKALDATNLIMMELIKRNSRKG